MLESLLFKSALFSIIGRRALWFFVLGLFVCSCADKDRKSSLGLNSKLLAQVSDPGIGQELLALDNAEEYRVTYKGEEGPGKGKHIVFIATDHEYRGEETLPALARILAKRYGFTCTVVWALDDNGNIFPGGSNLKGLEVLKEADLMVIFTRFSNFEDKQMQYIDDYLHRGRTCNWTKDIYPCF